MHWLRTCALALVVLCSCTGADPTPAADAPGADDVASDGATTDATPPDVSSPADSDTHSPDVADTSVVADAVSPEDALVDAGTSLDAVDSGGSDTQADDSSAGDTGSPPDVHDVQAFDASDIASADAADVAADVSDTSGGAYDGHTVPYFLTEEDFFAFADTGDEPVQCKFILTRFGDALGGETHFMDPTFYSLHDEWYWFRMLNGVAVEGFPVEPVEGLYFPTVEAIIAAFEGVADLPLGLIWYGERLYAPEFYNASFAAQRFFGLGSLLHYDPNPDRVLPEELWLFELEFVDKLTEEQLQTFFDRLEEGLPAEIGSQLRWITRSVSQDALGAAIKAAGGPLAGRIISYADLVVKGEVVGYNPGIVAGYLHLVPKGAFGGASVGPNEIVVLEEVPDYLPPVAAIVTAVPQTPLAHLNLLAKSRGTPNVYVAGVFFDPGVLEWANWTVPVILKVTEAGALFQPITKQQYNTYKSLKITKKFTITEVDVSTIPYTVDLTQGGVADLAPLVPICGGKAAGMMGLQDFPAADTPELPLCLTIRGYAEHVASLKPTIEALLTDGELLTDPLVRFLALEGEETFTEQYPDATSQAWLDSFLATHGPTSLLGGVVAQGGLKEMIRDKPMSSDTLAMLTDAISDRYASFADSQGLRFRSSSTAEDVPGFNGAGLYDSNTGFLHPEKQPASGDKKKSLEWAIKKTWASYWTFEAFEERAAAGISHLSGNMSVLVHARFDDDLEVSNGVVTAYLARSSWGDSLRVVLNAQKGALSVTNPEPGNPAQPEIDVIETSGLATKITRVQPSTEVSEGEWLISDETLGDIFDLMQQMTVAWLDAANATLDEPQKSSSIVLDLEFRSMAEGWPALASGQKNPPRFVWKQVRTLDESAPMPLAIEEMPVPRDVLGKTVKVQKRTCTTDYFTLETVEHYTTATYAFDYSKEPFNSSVDLSFSKDIPGLSIAAGALVHLLHTDLALMAHPFMHHGPWDLYVELLPEVAAAVGFEQFQMYVWGDFTISGFGGAFSDPKGACATLDLLVSPAEYLESLLGP